MNRGICLLETNDTAIEKAVQDQTHTGEWNLAQAVIAAIKAFDAACPPSKGCTTLASQVTHGLQGSDKA